MIAKSVGVSAASVARVLGQEGELFQILISSGTQRLTTAGKNDRKALRGCQRLAVGRVPPYTRGSGVIPFECHGGRDEFASAAFQKRRTS